MNKIEALARYLEIKPEEIKVNDARISPRTEFYTPNGTFLVMDEEEAFKAVEEEHEWFIDDLGIEGYTPEFQDWIYENALDQEFFEELCKEDYKYYAEDIKTEMNSKYGNRLNEECVEARLIEESEIVNGEYVGEKDLIDELAHHLTEEVRKNYNGNFVKHYTLNFGTDFLKHIMKTNEHIDYDYNAIAKESIKLDGYGHFLSYYDGKTIELDDGLMAFLYDDYDRRDN